MHEKNRIRDERFNFNYWLLKPSHQQSKYPYMDDQIPNYYPGKTEQERNTNQK